MTPPACPVQKGMLQMNLFTKQKETHRLRECTFGCHGGRMEGRDSQGAGDGHGHTAVFKMGNKGLLYSTWNSVQCYVAAWIGGSLGANRYMYMHG